MVPVEVSRIALPTGSLGGCNLEMNVAEQDRHYLAGDGRELLRPLPQVRALNEALGDANSYMDERMTSSKRVYAQVIKKCQNVGILTLSLSSKSTNGVFFVKRKDSRLRMIIDCRRTNRLLLSPPGTDLITGEGLGELEVDDASFINSGCPLFFGCADVDSCFHRLVMPEWLQ